MASSRSLTDKQIDKAASAPKGKRYYLWDPLLPSFGVRITDKGHKSFFVMRRLNGRLVRRTLGGYPALTLATARDEARSALLDLAKGIDPKLKQDRIRAGTFLSALDEFNKRHLVKLRSGKWVESTLRRELSKKWGNRPLNEITRQEVIAAIELVLDQGKPYAANRLLAFIRKFFNWCLQRGLVDSNPCSGVQALAKETSRDRVLSEDEIRWLWTAWENVPVFGAAFQFLLATGQRRSEVANLRWADIDFDKEIWNLPREITKANRSHEVPLSATAMSIIKNQEKGKEYVFTTGGGKPLGGWSKAKERSHKLALGLAIEELAELPAQQRDNSLDHWRIHDLRRTAGSHMARMGVQRFTISRLFNHAEGGVTNVYDRYSYLDEKRHALVRWSSELVRIVNNRPNKTSKKAA